MKRTWRETVNRKCLTFQHTYLYLYSYCYTHSRPFRFLTFFFSPLEVLFNRILTQSTYLPPQYTATYLLVKSSQLRLMVLLKFIEFDSRNKFELTNYLSR